MTRWNRAVTAAAGWMIGSPVTLTAPAGPGNSEIWYASDRTKGTFKSIPIIVR